VLLVSATADETLEAVPFTSRRFTDSRWRMAGTTSVDVDQPAL
jgi:hypothetical protein